MSRGIFQFDTPMSRRVADKLFTEVGAILDKRRSPEGKGFRLKKHQTAPGLPLSPYYVNLRLVQSFPQVRQEMASLILAVAQQFALQFDLIAGIPMAAVPIATTFSDMTGIPQITPRGEKDHGTGGGIDGVFQPGQKVLVVDDLITAGNSKIEAIAPLLAKGLEVRDIFVFVDREEGGVKELERLGYNVHVVYRFSELLNYYCYKGLMTAEMRDEIVAYIVSQAR